MGFQVRRPSSPSSQNGDVRPLFRPEAVDHARYRWLGETSIQNPATLPLFTALVLLATVAAIIFLSVAQYTRRIEVGGVLRLHTGTVPVSLPMTGDVEAVNVREGQHVTAGRPVLIVSNRRTLATRTDANQIALEALRQRRAAQAGALAERRVAMEAAVASYGSQAALVAGQQRTLDRQIAEQRRRVSFAAQIAERYKDLEKRGLVPLNDVILRQDQLSQRQQELNALSQQRIALDVSLSQLRAQMTASREAYAVEASNDLGASAVLTEQSADLQASAKRLVTAPVSGTVTAVRVNVGERVQPGRDLFSIVPDGAKLEAILDTSGEVAGIAKVGQPVLLRIDAFPYQEFGLQRAVVTEITRAAVGRGDNASQESFQLIAQLERPAVVLGKTRYALKPGMTVRADVLLDRHSLMDWLLDPLRQMFAGQRS
jgi:membrane fusion protein